MRTSGRRLNTAHELCMTKTIATSSAPIHLITGVTAVGPDRAAYAAAVGRWIIWSVDGQHAVVHLDSLRTHAKGATIGITLPDFDHRDRQPPAWPEVRFCNSQRR